MPKIVHDVSIYMQQSSSADAIFQMCFFFEAGEGVTHCQSKLNGEKSSAEVVISIVFLQRHNDFILYANEF